MAPKKTTKRKHVVPAKPEDEKHLSGSEESVDSGTEDLLSAEVNNDEDSSDEEAEDISNVVESDEEKDPVVFESDEEEEELEFKTDSENESDESESDDDESDEEPENHSPKSISKIKKESSNVKTRNSANVINKIKIKDSVAAKKKPVKGSLKIEDSKSSEETETSNGVKNVTAKEEKPVDEYEYDSSDEEDIRNTVGNIPMKWYDEYDHIGYNTEGKMLLKPKKGDELDNFLKRMEDPDFWRTVKDHQTGQDVVLSEGDIELITRIQQQKIPDVQFDEYAPWIEWFTSKVEKMPLRKFPEHKRSFLPSKLEAQKVSQLVHALKMGWIKTSAEMKKERQKKKEGPQFYMLWETDDQPEEMRRIHKHIAAPKRFLPGHAESYNPPAEYLFDSKELKDFGKLKQTPWKRKLHFIPQKFGSLREVPAYEKFIKERFQRCLDLYLCPRAIKMKLTIEPEELVPQLPSPKDLQPFPTRMSMIYKGHTDMIRSISIESTGRYLASGGDDMTLRIWEIDTGRCRKEIPCGGIIRSVAWSPNKAISLIAVAADKKVILINPGIDDHATTSRSDKLLEIIPQSDAAINERVRVVVQWEQAEGDNWEKLGMRVILNHFKDVKQVTWHGKGDYFATVMPEGQNRSVLIHQLSKRRSQFPFNRSKGLIQCVLFHPIRPFFFVATQRHVRIYDLMKQEMVKKLMSNSQWISTMAVHPGGDNILVATYDRKMLWFDLDLSSEPYQTLRLHGTGVRGVAFHKHYPLFASGADDRGLIISHGMVYNDLLQNPLIVPLKRLCNHESFGDFGILDVIFHPTQPWVFSAGADATIRLYT